MRNIFGRAAASLMLVLALGACTDSPIAPGNDNDSEVSSEPTAAGSWFEAVAAADQAAVAECGAKLINDSILESGSEAGRDRIWRTYWRANCAAVECQGVIVSGDTFEAVETGSCRHGDRDYGFDGELSA